MVTVRDLIKNKGNKVWCITSKTTVLEALKMMSDKEVGALLVLENEKVEGIVSERDFARAMAKADQNLLAGTVENIMSKGIFSVGLSQSIDDCMQLMTIKRIRHLPVIENGQLVGLISIGDVVKEVIASKDSAINDLENYIQGRGYSL
jgi:CBS domain-containing protein